MTEILENRTFAEIALGDSDRLVHCLSRKDIELFAIMSGDVNPAHLDDEYARSDLFNQIIAHGMWGGTMISTVLGTKLPGPGTIYLKQTFEFLKPVKVGDEITATVTVTAKDEARSRLTLLCQCTNQHDHVVIRGDAVVIAPKEKIIRPAVSLPQIHFDPPNAPFHESIIAIAKQQPTMVTAVVHPTDSISLQGVIEATEAGLIQPLLIGPKAKLEMAATEVNAKLSDFDCHFTPHSHAAAEYAVELVHQGRADALMKGKLHTDELMQAVIKKTGGLRTARRMSHLAMLDIPQFPRPLFVTDAAINIAPNLTEKQDIVQNSIDLFQTLYHKPPRVALLSAVETVNQSIPSTLDATALCKMADRGQIRGAVLDGPLAFDNAISEEAAAIKGIQSPVAGRADILVVPDLESGNMVMKQMVLLSHAQMAGVVLGAKVPIILTSRADPPVARLASTALAVIARSRSHSPATPERS